MLYTLYMLITDRQHKQQFGLRSLIAGNKTGVAYLTKLCGQSVLQAVAATLLSVPSDGATIANGAANSGSEYYWLMSIIE